MPAKAGIQSCQSVLDPGACPGPRSGIRRGDGKEWIFKGLSLHIKNYYCPSCFAGSRQTDTLDGLNSLPLSMYPFSNS
jgi:hypothetical protein